MCVFRWVGVEKQGNKVVKDERRGSLLTDETKGTAEKRVTKETE